MTERTRTHRRTMLAAMMVLLVAGPVCAGSATGPTARPGPPRRREGRARTGRRQLDRAPPPHARGLARLLEEPGRLGNCRRGMAWHVPDGVRVSDFAWPAPARLAVGPLANYGYEGEVLPADARHGRRRRGRRGPPRRARRRGSSARSTASPSAPRCALALPVRAGAAADGPAVDAIRAALATVPRPRAGLVGRRSSGRTGDTLTLRAETPDGVRRAALRVRSSSRTPATSSSPRRRSRPSSTERAVTLAPDEGRDARRRRSSTLRGVLVARPRGAHRRRRSRRSRSPPRLGRRRPRAGRRRHGHHRGDRPRLRRRPPPESHAVRLPGARDQGDGLRSQQARASGGRARAARPRHRLRGRRRRRRSGRSPASCSRSARAAPRSAGASSSSRRSSCSPSRSSSSASRWCCSASSTSAGASPRPRAACGSARWRRGLVPRAACSPPRSPRRARRRSWGRRSAGRSSPRRRPRSRCSRRSRSAWALPYVALAASPGAAARAAATRGRGWRRSSRCSRSRCSRPSSGSLWVFGRQAGPDAQVGGARRAPARGLRRLARGAVRDAGRAGWRGGGSRSAALVAVGGRLRASRCRRASAPLRRRDARRASSTGSRGSRTRPRGSPRSAPRAVRSSLDFTAAWCITCQVNERVVFGSEAVRAAFRELRRRAHARRLDDAGPGDHARARRLRPRAACRSTCSTATDPTAAPMVQPTILTPAIVLTALRGARGP